MKVKSFADMPCYIAKSLDIVGPWWTLLIVREALTGATRFKHFEKSLGIAKNTLTTRLNHMIDNGLIERVAAQDGSKFDEYRLTEKGRALGPVLSNLQTWGKTWLD